MTSLRRRVLQRALPLVSAAALTLTTLAVVPAAQAAAPATVSGQPCAPGEGVTVVVDLLKAGATPADPVDELRLGCAPGSQTSGLAALANAGFEVNDDSGPGTVCQIDGLPAVGFPGCWNDGYWSYWRSDGTEAWDFSDVGAGGTGVVPVDSVEGWSYALGSEGWASAPPRVAVADLADLLDDGPFTDLPQAPVLSTIAASETLTFTKPQGSGLEIAVIEAGDALADVEWSTGTELALAAYEGQDIRVLARIKGSGAASFDATYRVRATYPPGRGLGTEDNPDVSVPGTDTRIKGWATGVSEYVPGTNVNVGFQTPERALGPVGSDLVVLGDRGTITLTFDRSIGDRPGPDLAVYENGFRVGSGVLDFLELGRIAVSSNGTDFATFDSAAQRTTPVGAFVGMEASQIGGLAGRDLSGQGTPFDLAALSNDPLVRNGTVDLHDITHVKVIDVVGDGTELDSFGRPIYDPFPLTGSAGFDLTGIAVLNEAPLAPAAPLAPEASVSGADVAVTWQAPDDGGSAITGYTVSLSRAAGDLVTGTAEAGDVSTVLAGVAPGTWTASVVATNVVGDSEKSDESEPVVVESLVVEPEPLPPVQPTPAVGVVLNAVTTKVAYGQSATVAVSATSGATGAVSTTVGDQTVTARLVGGSAALLLPPTSLAPGSHTLTLAYGGVAGSFQAATGTARVRVAKASPTLRVKAIGKTVKGVARGRTAAFRVAVTADGVVPAGKVRIKVAGTSRTVTLNAKGRATLRIKVARKARIGRSRVRVVYLGDDHVLRAKAAMKVRVRR